MARSLILGGISLGILWRVFARKRSGIDYDPYALPH